MSVCPYIRHHDGVVLQRRYFSRWFTTRCSVSIEDVVKLILLDNVSSRSWLIFCTVSTLRYRAPLVRKTRDDGARPNTTLHVHVLLAPPAEYDWTIRQRWLIFWLLSLHINKIIISYAFRASIHDHRCSFCCSFVSTLPLDNGDDP